MLCLEECGIVLFCPKILLKSGKNLRFSVDFREFHILRDTMNCLHRRRTAPAKGRKTPEEIKGTPHAHIRIHLQKMQQLPGTSGGHVRRCTSMPGMRRTCADEDNQCVCRIQFTDCRSLRLRKRWRRWKLPNRRLRLLRIACLSLRLNHEPPA